MDTYAELDLGYWFEPFDDPDTLGYRALDVHIYRIPTCRHFDPDRTSFPTVNAGGALTNATITHPWSGRDRLPTAVGDIIIRDRRQKRVEAFTFGGEVTLHVFPDRTYCRFTSPAPFFARSAGAGRGDPGSVIVEEIEALLARRRAAWRGDDAGFSRRLAAIEPTVLYAATLKSLDAHFTAVSVGRSRRHYRRIAHDLQNGFTFLRNRGVDVERTPTLEALL
jgi:hypothetical protein